MSIIIIYHYGKLADLIKECSQSVQFIDNQCLKWEWIKFEVLEFTISYSKTLAKYRKIMKYMYNLENELEKADKLYSENPCKQT